MTQTEALRLAFEALHYCEALNSSVEKQKMQAINAIKAALEAKDEPVAWAFFFEDGEASNELFDTREQGEKWLLSDDCLWAGSLKPLYTTPPQRKPLTDEEIKKCWDSAGYTGIIPKGFARAIEAAHGIKENT